MKELDTFLDFFKPGELEVNEGALFYKGFLVAFPDEYYTTAESIFNNLLKEIEYLPASFDYFSLLNEINSLLYTHTWFLHEEIRHGLDILVVKSPAEMNKNILQKLIDRESVFLGRVVEKENTKIHNISKAIVQHYNEVNLQLEANTDQDKFKVVPVIFKGDQQLVVALFELMQISGKLIFQKRDGRFSTPQKHFENFMESNFHFDNGVDKGPVKNVAQVLGRIRNSIKGANENVITDLENCCEELTTNIKQFRLGKKTSTELE